MSATELTLNRINDKLRRLRKLDMDYQVFGAHSHRYQLGPRWNDAALSRWERDHAIALPDEYRLFLLYVGDGPCGPGYGLEPLSVLSGAPGLHDPFPFDAPFHGLIAETDPTLDNAARNEAHARYCEVWQRTPLMGGALSLVHYGCDIWARLVLNGPFRGQLWLLDSNEPGYYPFDHNAVLHDPNAEWDWATTKGFTFFPWYEHWLDHALRAALPP
jgi:hypothetical protein